MELLEALRNAGLISESKMENEINRKEKIRILKSQLKRLYNNPSLSNLGRIEFTENTLVELLGGK